VSIEPLEVRLLAAVQSPPDEAKEDFLKENRKSHVLFSLPNFRVVFAFPREFLIDTFN
jgi:hypothetical protein